MKKTVLILTLAIMTLGCGSAKPKSSFTLSLFANLENRKCEKNKIDGYLLQTGYFESAGSRNNVRTYQTFATYKDIVTVNTYPEKDYYYLTTNKPDIYNFIKKNGTFTDTATDKNDNGRTFLKYRMNNYSFYIGIEETAYGKIFKIQSSCD